MISGEKIVLKGLTKEATSLVYEWVNREEWRELTGTLYPVSEYEHEEWIKRVATASDKKIFLICDKESEVPIGTIGLKNFDYINSHAELFISIGNVSFVSTPQSKGGYGTDAVKTLTQYCFDNLNLHKIFLYVFASNQRAIRCYEKAGFLKEGVLKQHHYRSGKYEDVIVMAIISKS